MINYNNQAFNFGFGYQPQPQPPQPIINNNLFNRPKNELIPKFTSNTPSIDLHNGTG